jgi:acetyl esterase/lipase
MYIMYGTGKRFGIAAFFLKYRLPDDSIMTDKSIGPLQDAQRALQLVREHVSEWKIDPFKIGIMGFSAGGHLAATAGTHFEKAFIENKQGTNLRPDFMILVYPVISFGDTLGRVGRTTPPAFLILAGDDSAVKPENSMVFYYALRKNAVSSEMHICESGEHGFLKTPPFEEWFGRGSFWLKSNGWL